MKKIIFALFALCCSLYAIALDNSSVKDNLETVRSSKISPKISSVSTKALLTGKGNKVNIVKGNKKYSLNKKNPVCRVSCTFTVVTHDGQSLSYTATAGWFLMGCETAGERACEKARLAAIWDWVN